jgi:hypothetical protein
MSEDSPTARPNTQDGPDIDGAIVPPEEIAEAAAVVPEHVTPASEARPEGSAPVETRLDETGPEQAAPDRTAPDRTPRSEARPAETAPEQTVSEDTAPPVVYDLVEVPPAEPSVTLPVLAGDHPAAAAVPVAQIPAAQISQAQAAPEQYDADTDDDYNGATENQYGIAPRSATSAASMQSVYVPPPAEPRKKGNRGIGALIAVGSTVVFAGLYALLLATILAASGSGFRFDFLSSRGFYIPVAFFLVGFVVLALIVNRASWWAFVIGSLFVALFVYAGTIATGLLLENITAQAPADAATMVANALASPLVIAAALLAREVSMWMGAVISLRGRRVKAKNVDAQAEYERESAARIADLDTARFRGPQAAV